MFLFVRPFPVTVCLSFACHCLSPFVTVSASYHYFSLSTHQPNFISLRCCFGLILPLSLSSCFGLILYLSHFSLCPCRYIISVFPSVCFLVTVSPPQPPTHTSRHLTSQLKVEAFQSLQTLSVLFHGLL